MRGIQQVLAVVFVLGTVCSVAARADDRPRQLAEQAIALAERALDQARRESLTTSRDERLTARLRLQNAESALIRAENRLWGGYFEGAQIYAEEAVDILGGD